MIRGHQFNKVEMVQYTTEDQSDAAFEELVGKAERLVQELGLHYRLSKLAAGDCSFSMARTYDIEVWIPSMGIYKEVSSASNARDYQARRGNVKIPRRGQKAASGPHPQRLRPGHQPGDARYCGAVPERRRIGYRAGGAASLYGWCGGYPIEAWPVEASQVGIMIIQTKQSQPPEPFGPGGWFCCHGNHRLCRWRSLVSFRSQHGEERIAQQKAAKCQIRANGRGDRPVCGR